MSGRCFSLIVKKKTSALGFSGGGLCRRLREKEVKVFFGDEEGVLQRGGKNEKGCRSLQG